MFYHGSAAELKIGGYLIPQHSYLIPKEKVVYGTPERFFALIFIAKFPDEDIRHGYYSYKPWKSGEDKYVLEELKPGMFEKHLKNKSGYIYTVSGNQFVDHENLHLHGLEFISKDPPYPHATPLPVHPSWKK